MTISSCHRFLAQRRPAEAGRRIWVLSGQIQDWFFHNEYEGCVRLRQTLELWAREHALSFSVVLTRNGDLDFSGNSNPQAAEEAFTRSRRPRQPRFDQVFNGRTSGAPNRQSSSSDGSAAARASAEQVGEAVGGDGQAIVNRLGQIARSLASDCHCLVVIEELPGLIETLRIQNPLFGDSAQRYAQHDIHGFISHSNILVLPTLDAATMAALFPADRYLNVEWIEIRGPEAPEIKRAIERLSIRSGFDFSDTQAAAKLLQRHGNLRVALGNVARVHAGLEGPGQITIDRLLALPAIDEAEVGRIRAELDRLVGLDELKAKVGQLEQRARRRRRQLLDASGEVPKETLHMVFTGSSGVGKTTVAEIISRLFHALGLLRRKEVKQLTASSIISQFTGATGENMQKALDEARGGVLFLDEAHQLGKRENGEEPRESREAINALVPMSYNYRHEMVIILAGYAQSMPRFFAMDEGLESRFPPPGRFDFPHYTLDQLLEILIRIASRQGFTVAPDTVEPLRALVARRSRLPGFGNARGVENLWDELRERCAQNRGDEERTVRTDDLPPTIQGHDRHLREALETLDRLVGLREVRDQIEAISEEIRWAAEEDPHGAGGNLHPGNMLLLGPPGTGKTTVARVLGRVFFGFGLLERPDVVVADVGSLTGRHVGDTENNLRQVFERARGAALLIDEAYQLGSAGGSRGYEVNALNTLVSETTKPENSGTLIVLAGYEEPTRAMLATNPGLTGRFPVEIRFSSLSPEECAEVARRELSRMGLSWQAGVLEEVAGAAAAARARLGEQFYNARWVLDSYLPAAIRRMKRRTLAQFAAGDPRRRLMIIDDLRTTDEAATHGGGENPLPVAITPWSPAPQGRLLGRSSPALRRADLGTVAREIQTAAFQVMVRGIEESRETTGYASGFFVSRDGLFATSRHVVAGAREVHVLCGDRRTPCSARVVGHDEELDLALLAVDNPPPVVPLPLGESTALQPLSELVVFGNAHVSPGEPGRIVLARVVRNDPGNARVIECDGSIEPGFSGGPAVDPAQGAVVGVVHGGFGVSATVLIRAEGLRVLLADLGYVFCDEVAGGDATQ